MCQSRINTKKLNMTVNKYDKTSVYKISGKVERRISYLENLLMATIDFSGGPMPAPDPPHSHPHEQISYVASGELFVFINNDKFHLKEGDVFTVPSGVPHTVQTLTEKVRLIDSFSPVREDFIKQ